jgi:DNA-directed RNA polymerase specialized sigma24 family protein
MPQLGDKRRAVVERTFHGAPLPQICAELELSKDNAYQLRSRGLKDLAKLYEQYGT